MIDRQVTRREGQASSRIFCRGGVGLRWFNQIADARRYLDIPSVNTASSFIAHLCGKASEARPKRDEGVASPKGKERLPVEAEADREINPLLQFKPSGFRAFRDFRG